MESAWADTVYDTAMAVELLWVDLVEHTDSHTLKKPGHGKMFDLFPNFFALPIFEHESLHI